MGLEAEADDVRTCDRKERSMHEKQNLLAKETYTKYELLHNGIEYKTYNHKQKQWLHDSLAINITKYYQIKTLTIRNKGRQQWIELMLIGGLLSLTPWVIVLT